MHSFHCEAVIEASPEAVWQIWTDVERWSEWDSTKLITRLDGPFRVGAVGWIQMPHGLGVDFTITAVEPGRRFTSESQMPLGTMVCDHQVEPLAHNRVRVSKVIEVRGEIVSIFRLVGEPKMRHEIPTVLAAMGDRARDLTSSA